MEVYKKQKIIVVPAQTNIFPSGKQIFFLFSLSQIEEIIKEIKIYQVPFSPKYIDGIANWQGNIIPVLSLEKCLGLSQDKKEQDMRFMLIKVFISQENIKRCFLKISSSVQMLSLPSFCAPVSNVNWLIRKNIVRGVYLWDKGYFIISEFKRQSRK